ncbi:MAG: GIY-YIG nuclease family protein [Gammaproteobacteria bacterium]|nr:GIY-YIG nuclease family protein [Gammaproteobacteria bacterium]
MAFVKLDTGILDSTLWLCPSEVRIVFITMLAMARPDGHCEATAPVIARRANLPVETVRKALDELSAPDPDSRSLDQEGRRIVRVDGGFQIVTYAKYRERDHVVRGEGGGRKSYVYFLRNISGLVKIGFSSNPWARARELETGSGKCDLLGVVNGDRQDESRWHRQFAECRQTGEWFTGTPELLAAIEAATALLRSNAVATASQDVVLRSLEAEAEAEAEEEREGERANGSRSAPLAQETNDGKRNRRTTAQRMPDDFALTAQRRQVAKTEHVDPERTFAKFCDHWRSASGVNARKLDWDAAWRNWCRREADVGRITPLRRERGVVC